MEWCFPQRIFPVSYTHLDVYKRQPNDAPNLWDANYARKHAYKGVADGLAGKDVSGDFTGDLE